MKKLPIIRVRALPGGKFYITAKTGRGEQFFARVADQTDIRTVLDAAAAARRARIKFESKEYKP